jgi:exopolysaccharide biosynthesis polyprenyl glycosylphosphotransferase
MLRERINAEASSTAAGTLVASSAVQPVGKRAALTRLPALMLPSLFIFGAATAVVMAHAARLSSILTAAILTAVLVTGLEAVRRSSWLSPLAVGVPFTTGLGILIALPAISLLDFWIPSFDVSFAELALVALATFVVWWFYWTWPSARVRQPRQRVLVIGRADGGAQLVQDLAAREDLPFECVGVVDESGSDDEPWLGDIAHLKSIVVRERIDIVVFADQRLRDIAMPAVLDVGRLDLRVAGLADFYELAFGRVPVDHLSETWFMSLLYLYRGGYPMILKRVFDIAIASFVLLVTAPLFPIIALLIVLETKGPVLFRQVRVGEGGELFEIIKFRTMVAGAEDPGQAVWAEKNDSRITSVGNLLRTARLDELPQLWNVLRGDMSLVGPRPERPEFLALLEEMVPFWSRRHLVKPGVTGWAQVCSGYTSDAPSALEKLSYDLYYIKHRSPILDLAVAAKTATVMISGSGAK